MDSEITKITITQEDVDNARPMTLEESALWQARLDSGLEGENVQVVYASESVTDTLAHVVAVLIEAQRELQKEKVRALRGRSSWLDESIQGAVDSGSALVEILRSKQVDAAENAKIDPRGPSF